MQGRHGGAALGCGVANGWDRVREHILKNPKREPCMFGTVEEVTLKGEAPGKGKMSGPVTFLKDDPGRQMIGSFHPLSADDW